MKEMSITELLKQEKVDVMDLWWDWFCKDSSLQRKGEILLKKLKFIAKSNKFDNDKCYVFFQNCCPFFGSLYDQFKICDIESGEVLYCVTPKSGHSSANGLGDVYGYDENGNWGKVFEGKWKEIKKWFLTN